MQYANLIDTESCKKHCTCGNPHPWPDVRICLESDDFKNLASDCETEAFVLVIDDENTHKAAGRDVARAISRRGVPCLAITLPGDTVLTDHLVGGICEKSWDHSLIIAVGAGTINDLGKSVSTKTNIPYRSVPTAASMNGYTSAIAAVKVAGVKRTVPAQPPKFVYLVPRVIRDAPPKLRQSGFCDVLAKSVSDIDWQTESLLFGGGYCGMPSAIVSESEGAYITVPEKIGDGDETAITGLLNGLLVSGIAMSIAGSSAPASGGEHLLSHVLDMRETMTGRKPELHGLQVGAGIVLSAACYHRLASLDASDLEPVAESRFAADMERIPEYWGPMADEVKKQFLKKRDRLFRFDTLLPENWGKLKPLFDTVRKPEYYLDLIRRVGFDMMLADLNLDPDEFLIAAKTARTIRDRVTVLDLAAHAGVLEEAAEEAGALLI